MTDTTTIRNGAAVTPVETIADVGVHAPGLAINEITLPFSQREHTLMLEAVDKIAGDWVSELQAERETADELEKKVLQRLSKLKGDLTQFFLLGSAVCSKVKRDHEFHEKLHDEIDRLAGSR
jgi:hypothetical protein